MRLGRCPEGLKGTSPDKGGADEVASMVDNQQGCQLKYCGQTDALSANFVTL